MNTEMKDEVVQLYLDDIIPNRFQPREVFDEKALKELAVSIKEHGVIQPIIVRNVNGKYEIIAGERRYKASALAGLTKIPAIIRNLDDKESSKVALLENLQRKNLNPIEEARTYQKILEIDQMTQEELAKTMGKSQSAVANKIRLLALPDDVQESLLKEEISERHARALLNVPDAKKQKEMLKRVITNKMSVRTLEEEIKTMFPKEPKVEESTEQTLPNIPTIVDHGTASINDFVNTSPLMPTAELPEDTSNYGKITIAPPEGEEMPENLPKFINYGEIDDDDNDEDGGLNLDVTSSIPTVNINQVKDNTADLNKDNSSADLDSLLNLNNTSMMSKEENEFMTPAEEIVKSESFGQTEKIEDYFNNPDLSAVTLPMSVPLGNPAPPSISINQNQSFTLDMEKYTIEEATAKIRELIEDLKYHGIKVNTDEMNFEKSYQIIIKLDKLQ